jgi:outer membrane protein
LRHLRKHWFGEVGLLSAVMLGSLAAPLIAQNAGAGGAAGNAGGAAGNAGGAVGNAAAGNAAGAAAPGTAPGGSSTGAPGANGLGGAPAPGATGGNDEGNSANGNAAAGIASPGMAGNGDAGTAGNAASGVSGMGSTGTAGGPSAAGGSLAISNNPAPQQYDISRTITDALRASAAVQTATRNVRIDNKLADAAAAQGRPNINGVASATRYDQSTFIALGGSPPIEVLPSHTELLQLNLGEDLDIAGQIRAATDQYHLQGLADQFILQQLSDARVLDAETIYFNLLRADHQVQVAQANLVDAQQNQTDAQNLFNAGTGQKIDLLRANTQVAQAQQQLTQSLDQQGIAQSDFNDLVGRPLDTPVTLKDVPGVTVGSAPANTGSVGAPTGIALYQPPTTAVSTISLPRSIQTADTNRPEILADQVDIQVARNGITLARAGLAPTLDVDASGNYYPTTSFQNPRQRTAQITATLTIPIYDGNGTQDQVKAAHLRQQNAQTNLDSEKTDVALDVSQAYLNLVTAAQQIAAANTALQQAIAARQLAELRYRGGVGLFSEVSDAQASLVQAENSQVNAVYDYLVSRAQFENSLGTPLAPL